MPSKLRSRARQRSLPPSRTTVHIRAAIGVHVLALGVAVVEIALLVNDARVARHDAGRERAWTPLHVHGPRAADKQCGYITD